MTMEIVAEVTTNLPHRRTENSTSSRSAFRWHASINVTSTLEEGWGGR